jgi:hypothetical protein
MSQAMEVRSDEALPATAPAANLTPMQMAYQLIQQGADLGSVKEMLAMSRELAAEQARQQFDSAMSLAKAEIPPIIKTALGHNNKKYADFASIAKVVDPIISKHGLSYRFRTKQDDRIHVTCVLAHDAGHAEETTLAGPADQTGNKNPIQAIGSTLTYLQRYTLVQALGLAAAADDDGNAAGMGERISDEQARNLNDLIDAAIEEVGGSAPKVFRPNLLKYLRVENLSDLLARDYQKAVEAINSARPAK